MPSEELLEAAGLSAADAQLLMTKVSTGGGTTKPKQEKGESMPYAMIGMQNAEKVQAQDQAAWDAANTVQTPAGPIDTSVQVPAFNDVAPAYAQVYNPDPKEHSFNEGMQNYREKLLKNIIFG